MRQKSKNQTAFIFILLGLISGIVLSLFLPQEKLVVALSGPTALIGAGLTQWSSSKEE